MPLKNLNNEQLEAATCNFGHNLIIASAGTGKTSTIVGRIAYLLKQNIKPQEILLLTFTNKAAMEMVQRVGQFFGKDVANSIMAGTFHSISYKLLKQNNNSIQLKQPSELKTLFRSIYEKRVFFDQDEKNAPYDGGYLYDIYSLYLNSNHGESFTKWLCKKNTEQEMYCPIYEDVILEFSDLKQKYCYLNFDDLLLAMLSLLRSQNFGFQEILVDEYQDTNPLQGRLLDSFLPPSLFCVGDYDQSIYAFNGSDIEIISTFSKRYSKAQVFALQKNYRSKKPILDLANQVIQHNPRVYEKQLEVMRQDSGAQKPKLLVFDELFGQYEYIAKDIAQGTTPYSDIAIIFRNNASADGIEVNLRDYGIPSKRKGGMSFFDAVEIKFVIDLVSLQVSHNDMMAFIHIVEHGKGIGKAIAKDLFDAFVKLGNGDLFEGIYHPDPSIKNPFETTKTKNIQLGLFDDFFELGSISKFKDCNFSDAFLSNPILKHPKLTIDGAKFLYSFYMLVKETKRIKNPKSLISYISSSLLYSSLKEKLSTKRATAKDGSLNEVAKSKSLAKINSKIVLLKNLSTHYNSIEKFLNSMMLGGSELSEGKGVNLLSVHASKGLEFTKVYVIDLMEGRFPNTKLMSKGGSLEEERRLFYVAVTRAKDFLYLSYAKYDRIKKMDFVASTFLKEAGLLK